MNTTTNDTADAYTIDEWCRRHRLSRATFYNLLRRGEAPRVMKVGIRTLISREASDEWRRRLEAELRPGAESSRHS
jgi:excisionase family DNA binding protein